jgi:hypothetical protein
VRLLSNVFISTRGKVGKVADSTSVYFHVPDSLSYCCTSPCPETPGATTTSSQVGLPTDDNEVFSFARMGGTQRLSRPTGPLSTGQPTRGCSWADYQTGFTCNGLGYVKASLFDFKRPESSVRTCLYKTSTLIAVHRMFYSSSYLRLGAGGVNSDSNWNALTDGRMKTLGEIAFITGHSNRCGLL